MLKVMFKHDAFIGDTFYSADKGFNLVPEKFKDQLPSTARIIEESVAVPVPKPTLTKQHSLSELDAMRAQDDTHSAFKRA